MEATLAVVEEKAGWPPSCSRLKIKPLNEIVEAMEEKNKSQSGEARTRAKENETRKAKNKTRSAENGSGKRVEKGGK